MNVTNKPKTEKSAKTRDFSKNSLNFKKRWDGRVARGAGFEPARPLRTTGLAGLDSSKRR